MNVITSPIRQIAYFASDVRAAAERHSELYGSGPYFVADNIPLAKAIYRGTETTLDHSSAYGQWGELMVEFVQQNNPGPSVFRDLYPDGEEGIHHVAIIVDDLVTARTAFQKADMAVALHAEMMDGFVFEMIDAVKHCGHFIELYESVPTLTGFYDMVRDSSIGFDGRDPVRSISI